MGSVSSTFAQRAKTIATAVLLLAPGGCGHSPPSSQALYDTNRVLGSGVNVCRSIEPCRAVAQPTLNVAAGERVTTSVQCPATDPNLLGWDATHHEHISLHVLPGTQSASALRLIVANHADVPGSATVVLACTTARMRETSVLEMGASVPTGPLTKLR